MPSSVIVAANSAVREIYTDGTINEGSRLKSIMLLNSPIILSGNSF